MRESDDDLQFRKAEPAAEPDDSLRCVSCGNVITNEYFHAQGQVVCSECAVRIESGQKAPPVVSMATAVLYGSLAALAGLAIYAAVAIFAGLEVGLISILVGIMVGKAVRAGSKGLGGRPQQVLAVALTYFAISGSNIPIFLYHYSKSKPAVTQTRGEDIAPSTRPNAIRVIIMLAALVVAAPFLAVFQNPAGGLLSLVILFFGLAQAWKLTGRTDILVLGPYKLESVS